MRVTNQNVSHPCFQVATANLAWASVAIHQVQVCLRGVLGGEGQGRCSPEVREPNSRPDVLLVGISYFVISQMLYPLIFTYFLP